MFDVFIGELDQYVPDWMNDYEGQTECLYDLQSVVQNELLINSYFIHSLNPTVILKSMYSYNMSTIF